LQSFKPPIFVLGVCRSANGRQQTSGLLESQGQMSRRTESQFPATISLKECRDKGPVTLWLRQSDLDGLNKIRNAHGMTMPSATVAYHLFLIGMRCVESGLKKYAGNSAPVIQFHFDLQAERGNTNDSET
jgi:hypothetical protein